MRSSGSLIVRVTAIFIALTAIAPSAAAAPPDDACAFLTPAQVSSAVGLPMGDGSHVTPASLKTCTWAPSSGPVKQVKYVTLNLQTAEAYEAGKRVMQIEAMASDGRGGRVQLSTASAPGIGDDAYYLNMPNITSLIVRKGNGGFKIVMYGGLSKEKREASEKALAKEVVSKL